MDARTDGAGAEVVAPIRTTFSPEWVTAVGVILGIPVGGGVAWAISLFPSVHLDVLMLIFFGAVGVVVVLCAKLFYNRVCVFDFSAGQFRWHDLWMGCFRGRQHSCELKRLGAVQVLRNFDGGNAVIAVRLPGEPKLLGLKDGLSPEGARNLAGRINRNLGRGSVVEMDLMGVSLM